MKHNICIVVLLSTSVALYAEDTPLSNTISKAMRSALPDTGQTVRYTQTFGEDSDFTGNAPVYVDNGDGTVTDKVTGLMWQRIDGGEMTWENAKEYALKLKLADHNDWRLPNSVELLSIMNHGKNGPAMDTEFFPRSEARYWWTNATRADDGSKVWVVNTGGAIGAHAKSETISAGGERPMHVRCVRGESAFGAGPILKDNGDGTVTDQRTGLIWQKIGVDKGLAWEDALRYCSSLSLAGQSDWRMPNIKELRSINDDGKAQPSLDKSFFPGAQGKPYWSSTSQANRPERAWFVDFATGLITYSDKPEQYFVVAVRDGKSVAGPRDKPTPEPKLFEQKRGEGGSGDGKGGDKGKSKGGEKGKGGDRNARP